MKKVMQEVGSTWFFLANTYITVLLGYSELNMCAKALMHVLCIGNVKTHVFGSNIYVANIMVVCYIIDLCVWKLIHCTYTLLYRDLLFGTIYDTFSSEDNLSKTVFLEQLCNYITTSRLTTIRTVISKDFIGEKSCHTLHSECGGQCVM